jgi:C-terminal processing protease CtpA/Prc
MCEVLMTRRSGIIRPLFVLIAVVLLGQGGVAATREVDRLVTLAKVWTAVRYLHPFMLQKDVAWDGALVRAIPKVRAAASDEEFARAIGAMLEALGDPVTRVIERKPSAPAAEVPLTRWEGETLVISAGPYAEGKGGMALYGETAGLAQQIAKAKQVVIDVRNHAADPEEARSAAEIVSTLRSLTAETVGAPSTGYVFHSGYRPQQGTTSGGYYSGFLTLPGETFTPATGATPPSRVVFVTDADSVVPQIAVALHNAAKAVIVSNARLDERAIASGKTIDLVGPWRAIVRVGQAPGDFAADAVAADPMTEALAIADGRKAVTFRSRPASDPPMPEPRWRPDAEYKEMLYPDVEHRLLAAFRIWGVIQYFYPYKPLIGDWDAALADAIPPFIAARNEDEYALAVLQMVSRVEDGHSSAFGHPAVQRVFGTSRPPIEVREVQEEFIITRVYDGVPPDAGVHVGDVVVSLDGEPFRARVERLWKYVTASTQIARTNRVAAFALLGPKDSSATFTLRGANQQVQTVRIPRRPMAAPPASGEPYRIVDGNIGYVDLMRLTVPQVDAMFEALKGTTAIIFDIRGYPRGTAWSIAPRINTKGAKVGAVFRRAQVSGASTFEESASGFYFEQPLPASDKPKYTGKTVMLIDDRAISQSEHTCLFFEAANDTTFIGTSTAGANGDVTNFFLPGGFRVSFTGHDVRHADGRQLQRVGIQPHIRVAPTIEGLRAGRDEVLERAVAFIRQGARRTEDVPR